MKASSCPPRRRGRRSLVPLLLPLAVSGASRADCFEAAAAYQNVNPLVLRAIAWQESRGRASAVNANRNGSTDYGMMQINSIHLRELGRYGISSQDLMKPCTSVFVAAWYLRKKINKYGNTWEAVGAYHSETPEIRDRYARSIKRLVAQAGQLRGADFAGGADASRRSDARSEPAAKVDRPRTYPARQGDAGRDPR